ncbi:GNAT family N-acetyltransferase [Nocardiopsis algeriensis]|uniref:GNAT superfamily N-acetyltransferase n=1 Tax=Nocardiopsis algeriensis TaxID=1478215 RepID=A0A841IP56_9ACTN|nr:GNAT superfamily N-acetyltransferase [Nocardiopsis algeriensis]
MTTNQSAAPPRDPGLSYRLADPEDVPALVELVNSCYRGEGSKQGWTTEADLLGGRRVDEDSLARLLERTDTIVLIAEDEEGIVACCELQHEADSAYFGMFSVRPAVQGGGLGKKVLARAEHTAAREWGCRLMRMKVLAQRPELIAWYERRGYTSTGRTEPFPYGDKSFGLPKREDLAFVELTRDLTA